MLTQHDQLDQAAAYIKQLRERIEELKERKELARSAEGTSIDLRDATLVSSFNPVFELRELGSTFEVILVSGIRRKFKLNEIISVLEEEGAEIVNASFSARGDKVFYTIHAQPKSSRVGVEFTRIYEGLQRFIC